MLIHKASPDNGMWQETDLGIGPRPDVRRLVDASTSSYPRCAGDVKLKDANASGQGNQGI